MKKLTMLIFYFASLYNLHSQSIKLNSGDAFSYRTSRFEQKQTVNKKTAVARDEETFNSYQIDFKVREVVPNGYKMHAEYWVIDFYTRYKKENGSWVSGNSYHSSLINEYSNFNIPGFKVDFMITNKGEIDSMQILRSMDDELKFRASPPDSVLINLFSTSVTGFFHPLHDTIKNETKVFEQSHDPSVMNITDKYVTSIDTRPNELERSITYERETGLLLEKSEYKITDDKDDKQIVKYGSGRIDTTYFESHTLSLTRTNVVRPNSNDYTYSFTKNGSLIDTTFKNTNVTIKGKIINPNANRDVSIHWSEEVPNAFNVYNIRSELSDSNTFEFHLKIDGLKKITLLQHERATFYVTPGDDLYITVDMNAFDETITAKGIGSSKLNADFKKFLFNETNQLKLQNIYNQSTEKCVALTPSEFKKHFLDLLDKKQNYLVEIQPLLAPEQYLAEYWEIQTYIVDILIKYPRTQTYYREEAGKEPFTNFSDEFFDNEFFSLIHPDNDMMAYYDGYDDFIREYVFFFLDDKMKELTGRGNTITVNNFFDNLYASHYGFSNSHFSGTTQYILKYHAVNDALRQASWEGFVNLYKQFITEYSHSNKARLLTEAYRKTEKVAPGKMAYNFELSDFDGNLVKLSDFKGKVVYIDFWSTSCTLCLGSIQRNGKKMEEAFKDEDIVFLYIALEENIDAPKKFMEDNGIEGIQLIAKGKVYLIREKYFFNAIPHYYIIDKEGRIVQRGAPAPYEILSNKSLLLDALEPI